jgi:hypothetical protein
MRPIAEGSVVRSMDYGEGGPDYQVHFAVTSGGCSAKIYGPPENCYPAEGPEWQITGVDGEEWDTARKAYDWVPIEKTHTKEQIDAVNSWAESLDLADECAEALAGERAASLERQGEYRRDAIEELNRERNER